MFKKLLAPNYYSATVLQLAAPLLMYSAIVSNAGWYWYLLSLVSYILYILVGHNIGLHRYFSHRSFSLSKPMEAFVVWCSTCCCIGSPINYVATHTYHHKNSDTAKDPHGPLRGLKSVLFVWHRTLLPCEVIITKNLVRTAKDYKWLHEYYHAILIVYGIFLYSISWKLLLFFWLLPSSIVVWCLSISVYMQHSKGSPTNTIWSEILACGEGGHLEHHKNPSSPKYSSPGRKDFVYFVIRLLSNKKLPR